LVVGARTFPGNPYDGHTLAPQIEQTTKLLEKIGVTPTTAVVDLGYRGVGDDVPTVQVIHRGKAKSLTARQKAWLRRRQAVEPAIGHLKADHRMDRCWLRGSEGDALHAVLCAAGFNIRWLLRAIAEQAAKAAKAFFFVLFWVTLWLPTTLGGRYGGTMTMVTAEKRRTRGVGAHAEERLQHPLWVAG
jgi:IS5 family transposase